MLHVLSPKLAEKGTGKTGWRRIETGAAFSRTQGFIILIFRNCIDVENPISVTTHPQSRIMTNRRQFSFEVAQMGKVWVASFSLLGISAIGATESAAINAVLDAFKTHNLGSASAPEDCEACS